MKDIYEVEIFQEQGFQRKECESCGRNFWTLDPDRRTCGDTPCDEYTFIDDPPIDKEYTHSEMENEFLSFFEGSDHTTIERYPVVARWRDDIYLTIASIADFQPWVTSGEAPPPANPLVVSQPSIRLNDIDNVGRSGRHFTLFFMGGHHAFNSRDNQIYWNDETVALCHDFLVNALDIEPAEITYVEDFWEGGGNAGEDFEVNVKGLELATLVFMHYGFENGDRYELPLKIVDTGYGIERLVWASQGTPNSYEAIFSPEVSKIKEMAGVSSPPEDILRKHSKLAGLMDIETGRDLEMLRSRVSEEVGVDISELDRMMVPLENVYAIADHLRCLAFMFGDGITPSNEAGGYLSRLVLRRTLRLMRDLELEKPLTELMSLELDQLESGFPQLGEKRDYILEVVDLEEKRYQETLDEGRRLVSRKASSLKKEGKSRIPTQDLIEFYDSHGLPPEIVDEVAQKEGIEVDVPEDFYMKVAESHSSSEKETDEKEKEFEGLDLENLSETEPIYYDNPYKTQFEAKILEKSGDFVVLDRTAFFPEGGGQPPDQGVLRSKEGDEELEVKDVQKENNIVIHEIDQNNFEPGEEVVGRIDWDLRSTYMRHHTATHVLLGALRKKLGDHVWQHGVQKGKESSRLDVSHFKRISDEELREIEKMANRIVFQDRNVDSFWMERNEAEKKYGHSLYQGGVVPGRKIRIVDIEDWNAQACAGTHCTKTGEVGLIKIIGRERIQDGVERLIFASGEPVLEAIQRQEKRVNEAAEILRSEPDEIDDAVQKIFGQWKEAKRKVDATLTRLAKLQADKIEKNTEKFDGIDIVAEEVEADEFEELIQIGENLVEGNEGRVVILGSGNGSASLVVMAGRDALSRGVHCGRIASKAAKPLGGGGGGKPQVGQGGGSEVENLEEAIKTAVEICKKQVKGE